MSLPTTGQSYSEIFGTFAPGTHQNRVDPTVEERQHLWRLAKYQPSPKQWEAHMNPSRLKLIAGGERGGKSYSAAMELVSRVHLGSLFWLIGPSYKLCRPEFQYLKNFFEKLGAIESLTYPLSPDQPCSMLLKGGIEITTLSAKDTQKIAGRAPDGILGCEAAQLDYETYLKCLGRLSEKNGWLWLSGTFENDSYLSWYAEWYERWATENEDDGASFSLPTWENLAVYPGGWDDPKIKFLRESSPSEEWFQERFAGIPCPPPTAVFKEFRISKHVRQDIQFQPYVLNEHGEQMRKPDGSLRPLEVEIAIDPGYNGAYAVVALQVHGRDVWVIDEVYHQSVTAEDIIEECKKREWWPNVRRGVIDIAGTQHQGMESHLEIWNKHARVYLDYVRVDIVPGIARLRTFLSTGPNTPPRIFYSPRCKNSIKEFTLYRYREVQEGRITSEKPIDSFNHAAKAVSYWLVSRFGFVDGLRTPRKKRLSYGKSSRNQVRFGGKAAQGAPG